jgi:hypothetical protein
MRPSDWAVTGGIAAVAVGAAIVLLWGLALGLLTIQP